MPPVPVRPLNWRAVAATTVLVAVGTALCILRQRGAGALHTLWAEDGHVFLQDAVDHSVLETLFRSYNGYFHTLPRLIAVVAAAGPIQYATMVMSGAGALGAALMAAVGYHFSAPHIASRLVRLVLAAFVVLLPGAVAETANNVANLHWYLLYASFWLLLWGGRRVVDVAVSSTVLALVALSDPLSVLLLPVLAVRLVALRGRRTLVPPVVFVTALAVHLIAIATTHTERVIHHNATWPRLLRGYVGEGVGSIFANQPAWRLDHPAAQAAWALLAVVLLAALVTAVARSRRAWLLGLLLVMSFLMYIVPARIAGYSVPRYWLVPALLILAALGVCVSEALQGPAGPRPRWLRVVVGLVVVAVAVPVLVANYSLADRRALGPTWEDGLRAARRECRADLPAAVTVRITPKRTVYDWSVKLPCDRLVPVEG